MPSWRILTATALAGAAIFGACGKKVGGEVEWLTSMEEGKSRSSAREKYLVVYYSADWSKMSEQFENDVLAHAEVEKKLASFITVHIDSDVDEETPKTYNITAYPTTVFYTPQGEEVTRVAGAVAAEEFLALLDDLLAGRVETLRELLAREKANPDDLELAYEVGTMYVETGRPEKARPRFEKILVADAENETGLLPGALMQRGFLDLVAQQPEEALLFFARVTTEYPDSPEAAKCHLYTGDAYHLMGNTEEAVAVYRRVVAEYPKTPEAEEAQEKLTRLTMFEETVEAFTQGPGTAETE